MVSAFISLITSLSIIPALIKLPLSYNNIIGTSCWVPVSDVSWSQLSVLCGTVGGTGVAAGGTGVVELSTAHVSVAAVGTSCGDTKVVFLGCAFRSLFSDWAYWNWKITQYVR